MTAKKRGLGRGLDALFSEAPKSTTKGGTTQLALSELSPNSYQPRASFDPDELGELAASIEAQGLIQPLLVTPRKGGGYTIVAGERRWRAAKQAGLAEVPVLIRDLDSKKELLEAALVENLQRSDLNAMEEAEAFERLNKEFGLSHQEIASRVGKSRPAVSNRLRLLALPAEVQSMVRDGRLTAGQARPLLSLPSKAERLRWAKRAVAEGLNARQVEAAAGTKKGPSKTGPRVDADTAAAAEKLTKHLQTKVEIKRRGKGGSINLSFHSEEELMGLYEKLMKA